MSNIVSPRMLAIGGGQVSSPRPAGVPLLATGPLPNPVFYFEDFFQATLAPSGWASGLTATPDTLVNLAPFGNPPWIGTEIVGTTGVLGGANSTVSPGSGCLSVQTGTTSGDTVAVDASGTGTSGGLHFPLQGVVTPPILAGVIGMWRVAWQTGHLANTNTGFGWVSSPTIGTDWISDPDTTLTGASIDALVFTKHAASYSGDTAGALVARIYDRAGTFTNFAEIITAPSQATFYKIEAAIDPAGTEVKIYVDRTLMATFPLTGLTTTRNLRPSIQQQSTGAGAKLFMVDCHYLETGRVTAR